MSVDPVPNIAEPITKHKVTVRWWRFFQSVSNVLFPTPLPFSGTITTAKITAGGANGSMTFVNGILISQVAAT